MIGGRHHVSVVDALLAEVAHEGGPRHELRAPGPGWFRRTVAPGAAVTAGSLIGELHRLGRVTQVRAPSHGVVAQVFGGAALEPVSYAQALLQLDPAGGAAAGAATGSTGNLGGGAARPGSNKSRADGALLFTAPTSGRFYGRSGPGKPAFVAVGDTISTGTTICLLEVMKTFNRVTYGGDGLPDRARVKAVLVADEADVNAGDALLELEALG